jgi:protease I
MAKKILMIATDGFEEAELFEPMKALKEAGAEVTLASLKRDAIQGLVNDSEKGKTITPDLLVGEAQADDYDALVLPGGVGNPDKLRMDEDAVGLARAFMEADKPVASICHGPWLLVEANVLKGRRLTSWPSLKTDIENAGGIRLDQEVVVDGNLITSRKPDDIPAFNKAILEAVGLKKDVAA